MSHTLKKCNICTVVSTKTSNHERYAPSRTSHYAPCRTEPFLNYFRSIKVSHSATVSKEFSLERCERAVFDFEVNFWYLHEQYQLSMTLKVHVIIAHYVWYFKEITWIQFMFIILELRKMSCSKIRQHNITLYLTSS